MQIDCVFFPATIWSPLWQKCKVSLWPICKEWFSSSLSFSSTKWSTKQLWRKFKCLDSLSIQTQVPVMLVIYKTIFVNPFCGHICLHMVGCFREKNNSKLSTLYTVQCSRKKTMNCTCWPSAATARWCYRSPFFHVLQCMLGSLPNKNCSLELKLHKWSDS